MSLPVATPNGIPASPPVDEIGRDIRTATQNGALCVAIRKRAPVDSSLLPVWTGSYRPKTLTRSSTGCFSIGPAGWETTPNGIWASSVQFAGTSKAAATASSMSGL